MNTKEFLSDVVVYSKYARYIQEENRRETWEEIVTRNKEMHIRKYPHAKNEIDRAYDLVYKKKVFPSMRSLQFAGQAIEHNNSRMFNCSFTLADSIESFSEAMFLLLGGTGLGVSVSKVNTDKLPYVISEEEYKSKVRQRFVVEDSIMGWAEAIRQLIISYTDPDKPMYEFDLSEIREEGAELKTAGGFAPGPKPLQDAIEKISSLFDDMINNNRVVIEPYIASDIYCHIADAVLAGGIRRAAMIVLFDKDDENMLKYKSGNWWEKNPQRARANISVQADLNDTNMEEFYSIFSAGRDSGAGEPGIIWTNDITSGYGINPCAEISLRPNSFCNLTTIDVSSVIDKEDLIERVWAATVIGTLQASYTDFHYLRYSWRKTTEEDALLGVSMTGIAESNVRNWDLSSFAEVAKDTNEWFAKLIGINKAKRVTAIKPEGTASLVAGTSSGIHAVFAPYYIRRVRVDKKESLFTYLQTKLEYGTPVFEDDVWNPDTTAVLGVPIMMDNPNAAYRDESALDLLKRMHVFQKGWIHPGHRMGVNRNNVSLTVSIREDEWNDVFVWMWENRGDYTGISFLPYDGGTYQQLPFEEITKEQYEELFKYYDGITFNAKDIYESKNLVSFQGESACSGGACEVTNL